VQVYFVLFRTNRCILFVLTLHCWNLFELWRWDSHFCDSSARHWSHSVCNDVCFFAFTLRPDTLFTTKWISITRQNSCTSQSSTDLRFKETNHVKSGYFIVLTTTISFPGTALDCFVCPPRDQVRALNMVFKTQMRFAEVQYGSTEKSLHFAGCFRLFAFKLPRNTAFWTVKSAVLPRSTDIIPVELLSGSILILLLAWCWYWE
jgi:hypothetical protein